MNSFLYFEVDILFRTIRCCLLTMESLYYIFFLFVSACNLLSHCFVYVSSQLVISNWNSIWLISKDRIEEFWWKRIEMVNLFFLILFLLSVSVCKSNRLGVCHTKCRVLHEHCNFASIHVESFRLCHHMKEKCDTKCQLPNCKRSIKKCFKKYFRLQDINNCVSIRRSQCRLLYPQTKKEKLVS